MRVVDKGGRCFRFLFPLCLFYPGLGLEPGGSYTTKPAHSPARQAPPSGFLGYIRLEPAVLLPEY